MGAPQSNLRRWEVFYAVAKAEGRYAEAPGFMVDEGIGESGISQTITALEESLNRKLFKHPSRKLTPAGQRLFERVRPYFEGMSTLMKELRRENSRAEGTGGFVRLAAPEAVMRDDIPAVFLELRKKYPNCELGTRWVLETRIAEWLRGGEIDLAIAPLQVIRGKFEKEKLIELRPAFVVRKEDFKGMGTVRSDDIMRMHWKGELCHQGSLITTSSEDALPSEFRRAMAKEGRVWDPRFEVASLSLIDRWVRLGIGIGLTLDIPWIECDAELTRIPIEEIPPLEFGAVWRGPHSSEVGYLVDLVKARAKALKGGRIRG